jgi:hypothetical protein
MFTCSEAFAEAIKDYKLFLSKKYSQKALLKLVCDRYRLSVAERAMLYRGISAQNKANSRLEKLIGESELKVEMLHIDAFNQLLTIGSYLLGRIVFLSDDGLLRDASEIHGKAIDSFLPARALEILMGYLSKSEIAGISLYFDKQVSGCEAFYDKLAKQLSDFILQPEIILSDTVDKDLINLPEGIICTSDSAIIKKSSLKIFDLARNTLEYHFWPKFFDLKSYLTP